MPENPKVAIVGSGAVGSYYGCKLAQDHVDVHFYLRSGYEAVKANGFEIRYEDDSFYLQPAQVYPSTQEIGPCDIVVIALKSTANEMVPELLKPLLKETTLVLTLQNGMGNLEMLETIVPAERILGGLCHVCINRVSPGIIENYLPGQLFIGDYKSDSSERTMPIVKMFERAGVNCRYAESLDTALWKKLCWNIPFNGLAIAGGGITTDVIMKSDELKALARLLMEEVQQAARALDFEISDGVLQRQFDITEPMGAYKPSSLIDYLEGRDVEVEAIWGEPLRRGEAAGVKMPHVRSLYLLIKYLVQDRG